MVQPAAAPAISCATLDSGYRNGIANSTRWRTL
jgi:hypothetical protein